jgi:hypothetical protein
MSGLASLLVFLATLLELDLHSSFWRQKETGVRLALPIPIADNLS